MNKILLICLIVLLTGCGAAEKTGAWLSGYTEICVNGVLYYQFTSGASVAHNTDGTVRLCK